MAVQQISVQDALWLNMDRPNNLMIIDSLLWFKDELDWDAARDVIAERMVDVFPVFSCKAVKRGDKRSWAPDPGFDIANHLIVPDLPRPTPNQVARAYMEGQRSKPLPKSKPLWEFHYLPRIIGTDGEELSVIMTRFHHSIADGVRLTQVLLGLCDPVGGEDVAPASVGRVAKAGDRAKAPRRLPGPLAEVSDRVAGIGATVAGVAKAGGGAAFDLGSSAAGAALGKAKQIASDPVASALSLPGAIVELPGQVGRAARATGGMLGDALEVVGEPDTLFDAFAVMGPEAEDAANTAVSVAKLAFTGRGKHAVWTGTPGVEKRLHAVDAIPLDRVKEIGRKAGGTVNDVLLTVVAGALSRYLDDFGQSVPEVLWLIPVSLQPFDFSMPKELGNHFALIAFQMPLDINDPVDRLHEVTRRIDKIKKSHEAVVTFGVQRVVASSPTDVSVFLTNWFANKGLGVLTNVPGPSTQVAFAGTPVEGMLGFAPGSGDQPMTVTIFSYNGRVHVGFGTDAKLVPNAERLPEAFIAEARALYKAAVGKEFLRDDEPVLD